MVRKIIKIDRDKCNGCGLCVTACHEGAIEMEGGKAKLARENYCDGLGDCLPGCPTGAITFEEREAPAYDEAAVLAAKAAKKDAPPAKGCPGAAHREITREEGTVSELRQWPCQIKLVPIRAPYFDGANILVAADCTAYVYANFHSDYMRGKVTLIGCPKLDAVDYSEKLTEIFRLNDIKSVTVLRMEVPCCGGLEAAVKKALQNSGRSVLLQVVTVTIDGGIIENKMLT